MLIYLLSIFLIVLVIVVILLIFKIGRSKEDIFLRRIDSLKEEFTRNIFQTQSNLLETQRAISQELTKLYEKIGSLDKESSEILNLSKSFHDILKPTKARGVLGESILGNLIKDVLPAEVVIPQYTFRNGRKVDFVIRLPQGLVPIDAKFSLEAAKNYIEANNEEERERQRKLFNDSVKKRIEETALYIFPDEGTTDFSLMYIPSEAVYYSVITETSLLDYAHQKRVFMVGPNTLYAYLKTIFIGFSALKIEKKVSEIHNSLRRLEREIEALLHDYSILGTHLRSAFGKYEEIRKRIEGVSFKLSTISQLENKEEVVSPRNGIKKDSSL